MSAPFRFVLASLVFVGVASVTGCAATTRHTTAFVRMPPQKQAVQPRRAPLPLGERIARAAVHTLDHYPPNVRDDCSGFVEASLAHAGVPMKGSTRMLWLQARQSGWLHRRRLPEVGDLAFFDDTYDRNDNGIRDDELSHIAIVLAVDADGTIELAHSGTSQGRSRFVMNLLAPHEAFDEDGTRINNALRRAGRSTTRGTLAGELLRGFATVRR